MKKILRVMITVCLAASLSALPVCAEELEYEDVHNMDWINESIDPDLIKEDPYLCLGSEMLRLPLPKKETTYISKETGEPYTKLESYIAYDGEEFCPRPHLEEAAKYICNQKNADGNYLGQFSHPYDPEENPETCTEESAAAFEDTYGYLTQYTAKQEFYDNESGESYYSDVYPCIQIYTEGTELTADDFVFTLPVDSAFGDFDGKYLDDGEEMIDNSPDFWIGESVPAYTSLVLSGDTTIKRGINWLTCTATAPWGKTYEVTWPAVGYPRMQAKTVIATDTPEDAEIDHPDNPGRKASRSILFLIPVAAAGCGILIFLFIKRRKIKFHGIFGEESIEGIVEKGEKDMETMARWYIPDLIKKVNEKDITLQGYMTTLNESGVVSLLPPDTRMTVIYGTSDSEPLYDGKANELKLFKILDIATEAVIVHLTEEHHKIDITWQFNS